MGDIMNIDVNYHSSIRVNDIYVDPYNVSEGNAKYIFITHSHYDHYSFEDINKIVTENTVFVCTSDVYNDLKSKLSNEIFVVEPNKSYSINGLKFETFSSYNINKKFHPNQRIQQIRLVLFLECPLDQHCHNLMG